MNWRNDPITEKQKNYILEMAEHCDYPLPPFKGTTKGEANDWINNNKKLCNESIWAITHGY